MTRPCAYLIAYDIREPRRLSAIHRFLKRQATPIQYSVFVGRLSPSELVAVTRGLAARIDPSRDDVRIYPLPRGCRTIRLGVGFLPEGVTLAGEDLPLLS